jgi:RluA family pseudouridine synthase
MWNVAKAEAGIKLLSFLQQRLPETYSGRRIKKAIENNLCEVNGKVERFASRTLTPGDRVQFNEQALADSPSHIYLEPSRILFEDSYFFIYDKPAGIPSDSEILIKILQKQVPHITLVHRLDRDTTGVLIFAKSAAAKEAMVELFRKQEIEKRYLAIVDGVPATSQGIIENHLGVKHHYQGQKIWGEVHKDGLYALTEWRCLIASAEAALLLCFPKTGRTHQIRVHLSQLGHSILGDYQYGQKAKCAYHPRRCLLHAESLTFTHPYTNQEIKISSPLPADMYQAIIDLFKKTYEKILDR